MSKFRILRNQLLKLYRVSPLIQVRHCIYIKPSSISTKKTQKRQGSCIAAITLRRVEPPEWRVEPST